MDTHLFKRINLYIDICAYLNAATFYGATFFTPLLFLLCASHLIR